MLPLVVKNPLLVLEKKIVLDWRLIGVSLRIEDLIDV